MVNSDYKLQLLFFLDIPCGLYTIVAFGGGGGGRNFCFCCFLVLPKILSSTVKHIHHSSINIAYTPLILMAVNCDADEDICVQCCLVQKLCGNSYPSSSKV